jgi:HAD superfamily hydrolase (TIGR01509 family)
MIEASATPLPGVPSVLHELKRRGLRLALASASVPVVIAASLRTLGVEDVFETRVSGHDVANGKPSPDIFLEAARRLALPPANCVAVEDSQNGLRAALAAGMRCAVVPCPSTAHQDFSGASTRLANLHALPLWLDSLTDGPAPAR